MKEKNYTFSFLSDKSPGEIFEQIKDVRGWWSGLYSEEFEGIADKLNKEFTFSAGEGMHYSKQKLVEMIPNKKLVWLVTDSKLSFLKNKNEWTGTRIGFEISKQDDRTKITFTHEGLVPKIECYDNCSTAWSSYMKNSFKEAKTKSTGKQGKKEK